MHRVNAPCVTVPLLTLPNACHFAAYVDGPCSYTPTIVDYSSVPLTRETLLSLPGAYLVHSKYSILQQVTLGGDCSAQCNRLLVQRCSTRSLIITRL